MILEIVQRDKVFASETIEPHAGDEIIRDCEMIPTAVMSAVLLKARENGAEIGYCDAILKDDVQHSSGSTRLKEIDRSIEII